MRTIAKIICCFIPVKPWRRKLRKKIINLFSQHMRTKHLIGTQYDKNGFFVAYDTCVRYAFAREYLSNGKKTTGFWYKMYKKMQSARGMLFDHNAMTFIPLIESYCANGYNGQKVILYKNGVILADGSHRLALNILFNEKWIYYKCSNHKTGIRDYGIDWFKQNGFTDQEIAEIRKIKNEIFDKYNLKKQKD